MGFLLHIVAPVFGDRVYRQNKRTIPSTISTLPRKRFQNLLLHLYKIIESLVPPSSAQSVWADYTPTTSYCHHEAAVKKELVASFMQSHHPRLVLDIGCNTGEYAWVALESGAGHVLGVDFDRAAVDTAFCRGVTHKLDFLPLVMDLANPSPAQGWAGIERKAFSQRVIADAVVALALIHHLCIGKNIPLSSVISFITSMAPVGLIEFVPKSDPQIIEMLRLREDIFPDYCLEKMRENISQCASIVKEIEIGDSGRVLFEYRKKI
jgi:ribosomal protein L11 methylase PrmA